MIDSATVQTIQSGKPIVAIRVTQSIGGGMEGREPWDPTHWGGGGSNPGTLDHIHIYIYISIWSVVADYLPQHPQAPTVRRRIPDRRIPDRQWNPTGPQPVAEKIEQPEKNATRDTSGTQPRSQH